MSVAFTKEESAETASETQLPDRPISTHPNWVTENGLRLLREQLEHAKVAYEAAQQVEDVNERRQLSAIPLRDMRYFTERVRTAQPTPNPSSADKVAFGATVTFQRADGRIQKFGSLAKMKQIQKTGSISFASPIAKSLIGKSVGDVTGSGDNEVEVLEILAT